MILKLMGKITYTALCGIAGAVLTYSIMRDKDTFQGNYLHDENLSTVERVAYGAIDIADTFYLGDDRNNLREPLEVNGEQNSDNNLDHSLDNVTQQNLQSTLYQAFQQNDLQTHHSGSNNTQHPQQTLEQNTETGCIDFISLVETCDQLMRNYMECTYGIGN